MIILAIISGLLLLANKFLVFHKKPIGWLLGMLGTIILTILFLKKMSFEHKGNFWIMIVYDTALFFLMLFGYVVSRSKGNTIVKNKFEKWNIPFKVTIIFSTVATCSFLLFHALTADLMMIQFFSTFCGLMGTLFLVFDTKRSNQIGWMFYCVAHYLATQLFFKSNETFLAWCQILSLVISITGLYKEIFKKHPQPLKS